MSKDESFYKLWFNSKIGHSCRGQYISVRVQNDLKKAVFGLPWKWRKNAITLASCLIKKMSQYKDSLGTKTWNGHLIAIKAYKKMQKIFSMNFHP